MTFIELSLSRRAAPMPQVLPPPGAARVTITFRAPSQTRSIGYNIRLIARMRTPNRAPATAVTRRGRPRNQHRRAVHPGRAGTPRARAALRQHGAHDRGFVRKGHIDPLPRPVHRERSRTRAEPEHEAPQDPTRGGVEDRDHTPPIAPRADAKPELPVHDRPRDRGPRNGVVGRSIARGPRGEERVACRCDLRIRYRDGIELPAVPVVALQDSLALQDEPHVAVGVEDREDVVAKLARDFAPE